MLVVEELVVELARGAAGLQIRDRHALVVPEGTARRDQDRSGSGDSGPEWKARSDTDSQPGRAPHTRGWVIVFAQHCELHRAGLCCSLFDSLFIFRLEHNFLSRLVDLNDVVVIVVRQVSDAKLEVCGDVLAHEQGLPQKK